MKHASKDTLAIPEDATNRFARVTASPARARAVVATPAETIRTKRALARQRRDLMAEVEKRRDDVHDAKLILVGALAQGASADEEAEVRAAITEAEADLARAEQKLREFNETHPEQQDAAFEAAKQAAPELLSKVQPVWKDLQQWAELTEQSEALKTKILVQLGKSSAPEHRPYLELLLPSTEIQIILDPGRWGQPTIWAARKQALERLRQRKENWFSQFLSSPHPHHAEVPATKPAAPPAAGLLVNADNRADSPSTLVRPSNIDTGQMLLQREATQEDFARWQRFDQAHKPRR